MRQTNILTLILVALFLTWLFPVGGVRAQQPVVHAVFFYSPGCSHCENVIKDVIPVLIDKYKGQLEIAGVDVSHEPGQQLYQEAVKMYAVPPDRLGVPAMVIGTDYLVGDREIPEKMPGMIDAGITAGGLSWPEIPGFQQMVAAEPPPSTAIAEAESQAAQSVGMNSLFIERFRRDPQANSLAVIVLAGMLVSVIILIYDFIRGSLPFSKNWPKWLVPVLAVLGLGISLYLSYVEVTHDQALCGPIGNCNSVQQSPYAYLFGFIPVGVMGAVAYAAFLFLWAVERYGNGRWKRYAVLLLWVGAWFGVLFSIYLTFLEPFVIGATCIWCLSSAIVITLILWATTPGAMQELAIQDEMLDEDGVEPA